MVGVLWVWKLRISEFMVWELWVGELMVGVLWVWKLGVYGTGVVGGRA